MTQSWMNPHVQEKNNGNLQIGRMVGGNEGSAQQGSGCVEAFKEGCQQGGVGTSAFFLGEQWPDCLKILGRAKRPKEKKQKKIANVASSSPQACPFSPPKRSLSHIDFHVSPLFIGVFNLLPTMSRHYAPFTLALIAICMRFQGSLASARFHLPH